MANAVDASTLGPGYWKDLQNVKVVNGIPYVRGGTAEIYAAPGSGTYKGHYIHPDLGVFVAIRQSSATRIYQNTGSGWAERTDASTRFATDADVTLAVIQAPPSAPIAPYSTTKRYVVAQNGTDTPLVMAESASVFTKHEAIAVGDPPAYRALAYYADFYQFALLDNGRAGSPNALTYDGYQSDGVTAQTRFKWATNGAGLEVFPELTISTSVTYDDMTSVLNSVDTINWSLYKQMHLLFSVTGTSADALDIFNQFKIEGIDNSSNVTTLYDPTDTAYAPPVILDNTEGKYLAAFTLPSGIASRSYKTLRFQWKGNTISSEVKFRLYACMASAGNIDGGSSFAVSHMNPDSFAESPSVVCRTETFVNGTAYGAPAIQGMNIPVASGAGYEFRIIDPVVSGVTNQTRMIYMAGVDAEEFYYIASSSSLGSVTRVTSSAQYPLPTPGGLHRQMPTGPAMKALGSRLMVGGGSLKDVWFSSLHSPLRFRPFLEFRDGAPDLQGAGTIRLQGESVQAIEPMAGTYAGSESVFIWTDQGLWRTDGSDSFQLSKPRRLSSFGTLSPKSVASHNGLVFWLDTERQVRTLGSAFDQPSLLRIDGDLAAIPDSYIGKVQGTFWNDAYYMAYTPSGGTTNDYVYVWDMRGGTWSKYTAPSGTAAGIGAGVFYKRKLCVFTSAGRVLEYDKSGADDLGSNVTITMQTRDLTMNHWDAFSVRRVGLVSSVSEGESLTVTRHTRDNSATPESGTISLTATTARDTGGGIVWRFDSNSGVQAGSPKDWGISIKVTGAVEPGWKCLSMVADVAQVQGGADVG